MRTARGRQPSTGALHATVDTSPYDALRPVLKEPATFRKKPTRVPTTFGTASRFTVNHNALTTPAPGALVSCAFKASQYFVSV